MEWQSHTDTDIIKKTYTLGTLGEEVSGWRKRVAQETGDWGIRVGVTHTYTQVASHRVQLTRGQKKVMD